MQKHYAILFVVREVTPEGQPLPDAEDEGSLYVRLGEVVSQAGLRDAFDRYRDAVCVTFNAQGAQVVELVGVGTNKIALIKAIRQVTGLGLKEAKDLSESASGTAIVRVRGSGAYALETLSQSGARVRLRGMRPEEASVPAEAGDTP